MNYYKELQYKLIKAAVEDAEMDNLKKSNDSVFKDFDWIGFNRFRNFIYNSRIRTLTTAFPMTLEFLGKENFLDLADKYNENVIFKGQSIKKDLDNFIRFLVEMSIIDEQTENILHYELCKYIVASQPHTADILVTTYNIIDLIKNKKDTPKHTFYLFEQRSYLEKHRVYEINESLYRWLDDVKKNKENNIDYYLDSLNNLERKDFLEGYKTLKNVNIISGIRKENLNDK